MNISIRVACAKDAQAVNDTYDYYLDHTVATFNEKHKTVEERRQEMLQQLDMYPFLIAEDEQGRFLGFACAESFRTATGYRYTPELTIYLHPDAPKGCGIGSGLYERLLAILTKQGFASAVGVLYGGNEQSLALHKRFGFEEVAHIENIAFKHGRWLDARVLRKTLCGYASAPKEPIPFSMIQEV